MAAKPVYLGGAHLSVRAFSEAWGVDRETIANRLREQQIPPSGKRGGYPVYRLADYKRVVEATDDGSQDPDKMRPFERKAHYQAEHEKLALEIERGQLVPVMEVEAGAAATFKKLAQWLDTFPDILERDCALPRDALAKVEQRVDVMRDELYHKLAADGDDGATSEI